MDCVGLQPEYVAGKVEGADLSAAVVQKFVAAHRASNHLIHVLGRFALAINLFLAFVCSFGRHERRDTREERGRRTNSARRRRRGRVGPSNAIGEHMGAMMVISAKGSMTLSYDASHRDEISDDALRNLPYGIYRRRRRTGGRFAQGRLHVRHQTDVDVRLHHDVPHAERRRPRGERLRGQ